MKNIEELQKTLTEIEEEKKNVQTDKKLKLLESSRIFMIDSYIVHKYILGQEFAEDDENYVYKDELGLKQEHNFNHPLPNEIYDLPKEELISIIKMAHNEREFEYEYKNIK